MDAWSILFQLPIPKTKEKQQLGWILRAQWTYSNYYDKLITRYEQYIKMNLTIKDQNNELQEGKIVDISHIIINW